MNKCYVCEVEIDMDMDKFCVREHRDGSTEYRHLWHGVPGITRIGHNLLCNNSKVNFHLV